MNEYLIPANSSRGKLILGYFRPVDLVIFLVGLTLTLILLLIFQNDMDDTVIAIFTLSPVLIALFLVMPIPYQNNILVLLTAIFNFYYVNRQTYVWRGWCFKDGEDKRK